MTSPQSSPAVPKDERCRLAKCPAYHGPKKGPARNHNTRCAACQGPVAWTDADGIGHGCARACTSCRMDGLGLPVCWAACPGPNADFQTDGQKFVTLGGMPDADRFVGASALEDVVDANDAVDRMVSGIDGDRDGGGDAGGTSRGEGVLLYAASRLLVLDSREWDELARAWSSDDTAAMAKASGIPRSALARGKNARRLVDAICSLRRNEWLALRYMALGRTQKNVADMSGIRKQAVNARIRRAARRHEWVGNLLGLSSQEYRTAGAGTRENGRSIDHFATTVNTKIKTGGKASLGVTADAMHKAEQPTRARPPENRPKDAQGGTRKKTVPTVRVKRLKTAAGEVR